MIKTSFVKKATTALLTGAFMMLSTTPQTAYATSTTPVASQTQPKLYGVSVSPYVRKVKVVLFEKNINFKQEEVLPSALLKALKKEIPADFLAASPLGKIPAYSEGDWSISDSSVITDYLETTHPEPALYPKDPKQRARALWFEKYADEVLSKTIHKEIFVESFVKPNVLKAKTDKAIVKAAIDNDLPKIFDYLESEIGDKQWLVGDVFSIADINIATHFVSLNLCKISVDKAKWPKLAAYIDRVLSRDSFKKATA